MLEYEFSELDNDFITLWSKYITTQDSNLIIGDLQKLARLGQVNAVQSWYLFKEKGDDKIIDSIVSGYTGGSYNELFAMGNFNRTDSQQKDKHDEMMDELRYIVERDDTTNNDVEEYASKVIKKSPCINPFYQAKEQALHQASTLEDCVIFQRANEMLLTYARYVPLVAWQNQVCKEVLSNCKVIRKNLIKRYNACLKKNPNFSVNDDPQLCYALAKSIIFLSDNISTSKRDKELGIFLIKQLANREYSLIKPKTAFVGKTKLQSILDDKDKKVMNSAEIEIESIFNKALQVTSDSEHQM